MTPPRLCLACRHAVEGGEACDQPDHETIALDRAGRERLLAAVWGDADQRAALLRARAARARRSQVASLIGGVAGTAAIGIGVDPSRPLMLAGGLLAAALSYGITGAVQRKDGDAAWPRAAAPRPPAPPFARGQAIALEERRSPVSDLLAAAWAIELTLARPGGPRVVFRDAYTSGFVVVLDGGAHAEVPRGPWRPAGPLVPLVDVEEDALLAHLRRVDPHHDPRDPVAPFHFDGVHEALILPGDRVELFGAWEPAPVSRPLDRSLYRDAPATVLRPVGWPTLRRARG